MITLDRARSNAILYDYKQTRLKEPGNCYVAVAAGFLRPLLAGEFGKYARCDWKLPFHFRFLKMEIPAELHVSLC